MRKKNKYISTIILVFFFLSCIDNNSNYYQCVTDDELPGSVKTFKVNIDATSKINNPCLIILARGVSKNEGFVEVNGKSFAIPSIPGASSITSYDNNETGKIGWYTSANNDDLLAKIIIPLLGVELKEGINNIVFTRKENTDGYLIFDSRITSSNVKKSKIEKLTYRVITRGEDPRIDDFDFVESNNGEGHRIESDLPDWAKRGKARYYRAGIDFENLDRMFEIFKQGHFNLVMLQTATPSNTNSEEYRTYKDFIDRCHENDIKVTFDGGAGNQPIRLNSISADSVKANPEMKEWLSRDEYGKPRWRKVGVSYWPDLNNSNYRNRVLKTAELAIDAGVDELYYDWAIGGTKGIVRFFLDVQNLCKLKGKNLTVFGNCKGNIIADEICDIGKSEGTEEAGVWDDHWVHNAAQAKFYYAAGNGWKPYRSKYEGADPGVPNPGAHSVIDEMKTSWQRPMAEARAFQSDFVIAEAGRKMLNGWVYKNDDVAVKALEDICEYNTFFDENEKYYTDIKTVSRIGVIAPPVIPSFESSVKRTQMYNALIEMNIMYDVLLLPKITPMMLQNYDLIIVPDIPWLKEEELISLHSYKEQGGKIFVIGSSVELQELASINAPAYLCHKTQEQNVRKEFIGTMLQIMPKKIIEFKDSEYVLANLVKKINSDQIIIHLVNYSKINKNIDVKINLEGIVNSIDRDKIRLYSPDDINRSLTKLNVKNREVEFSISELEIYDMIVIN